MSRNVFKGNGELASKDEVVPEVEGNKKRGLRCETSLFVSNMLFWPRVVKLVDTRDLKSLALERTGSIPVSRTKVT